MTDRRVGFLTTLLRNTVALVRVDVDLKPAPSVLNLRGAVTVEAREVGSKGPKCDFLTPLLVHLKGVLPDTGVKNTTFHSRATDPTWVSFTNKADGSDVSLGGARLADGTSSSLSAIQNAPKDGSRGQVLFDTSGRPVSATLSDGSLMAFQWLTPSRASAVSIVDGGQFQSDQVIDFVDPAVSPQSSTLNLAAADKVAASNPGR